MSGGPPISRRKGRRLMREEGYRAGKAGLPPMSSHRPGPGQPWEAGHAAGRNERKEIMMNEYCERCGARMEDTIYAWCDKCWSKTCKHGNSPAECNDCMKESDRAFDERRERE